MSILDCIFFFFKQKTAYEMRISDWSSDVCSSDLAPFRVARREMSADIAVGKCAENRVGQRVKRDIGIAMPFKSMTMRDFQPADPQRLARNQSVDVISHAPTGSPGLLRSPHTRQDTPFLDLSHPMKPRLPPAPHP